MGGGQKLQIQNTLRDILTDNPNYLSYVHDSLLKGLINRVIDDESFCPNSCVFVSCVPNPYIFIYHLSRPFRVIYVFINETQAQTNLWGL